MLVRPVSCFATIGITVLSLTLQAGISDASIPTVQAARQRPNLKDTVEELIIASGAQAVGFACYDLETGNQLLINPDEVFHAASTMKVPVMMEVFRQAKAGSLSLDGPIRIKNDFISIADKSHYSLSPESDSERSLYDEIGKTRTVRQLLKLMIDVSSNLATNLLIERVTSAKVMALMRSSGVTNTRILRGVEDGKAFQKGLNNVTTARDLMTIFRLIAERRAISPRSSDDMIRILLDQNFAEGIPAGVPANVKVAHKTGSITRVYHDAGIVYPPGRKPYVLVVLTRGIENPNRAHQLVAEISRVIYTRLT